MNWRGGCERVQMACVGWGCRKCVGEERDRSWVRRAPPLKVLTTTSWYRHGRRDDGGLTSQTAVRWLLRTWSVRATWDRRVPVAFAPRDAASRCWPSSSFCSSSVGHRCTWCRHGACSTTRTPSLTSRPPPWTTSTCWRLSRLAATRSPTVSWVQSSARVLSMRSAAAVDWTAGTASWWSVRVWTQHSRVCVVMTLHRGHVTRHRGRCWWLREFVERQRRRRLRSTNMTWL